MKDLDDEITLEQESIINTLILEMVEPVSITIEYILLLIECKLRIAAVVANDEHIFSYVEARYGTNYLPNLDKIKTLIITCINYENSELSKGNKVLYHAYSSVYKFVKPRGCDLPSSEVERIKYSGIPEDDPNYCFLSVNYSLLCNFRPSVKGENTLWYVTSNHSSSTPDDILQQGYYPLSTRFGDNINVDVKSMFEELFALSRNRLGILEVYSIPITELSNYTYVSDVGGIPSYISPNNSWEYIDNLQARLYNYNNLSKIVVDPN